MKLKSILLGTGVLVLLVLTGIGLYLFLVPARDVVNEVYATASEARARGAFEQGMVPDFLPNSAKEIIASRNLDLNRSVAEFSYAEDFGDFLASQKTTKVPAGAPISRPPGSLLDTSNMDSFLYVQCVATKDDESRGSLIVNVAQKRALFMFPAVGRTVCPPPTAP